MSKSALIIDDSEFMREFIEEVLIEEGFVIVGSVGTGNEGIELALEHLPNLITLDNVLPDMLGMDIARILKKEENISSKIIIISALAQNDVQEECRAHGVDDYLVKPFTEDDLKERLSKIF